MTRMPTPTGLSNTVLRHPRTLDQAHPYLRSSSVCLSTSTKADAAEIAAQKRMERIVITVCLSAAAVLAVLMVSGVVP